MILPTSLIAALFSRCFPNLAVQRLSRCTKTSSRATLASMARQHGHALFRTGSKRATQHDCGVCCGGHPKEEYDLRPCGDGVGFVVVPLSVAVADAGSCCCAGCTSGVAIRSLRSSTFTMAFRYNVLARHLLGIWASVVRRRRPFQCSRV